MMHDFCRWTLSSHQSIYHQTYKYSLTDIFRFNSFNTINFCFLQLILLTFDYKNNKIKLC